MPIKRIVPAIQHYAWGTTDAIPEYLSMPKDGRPWAEAWFGSHPTAPSTYLDHIPVTQPLPYLLKILSAEIPLSIQAHPTRADAERLYSEGLLPDRNHKPETIVALEGGLEARAGIRDAESMDELMGRLGKIMLTDVWKAGVAQEPAQLLEVLLTLPEDKKLTLVSELLASVDLKGFVEDYPEDRYWTHECARIFTSDIGVAIQLLMNYVQVQPGQGIHMQAGELHAYLRGTGVEIMANSDNVLRAGLTPKPLAIKELKAIGSLTPTPPRISALRETYFAQTGVPDYSLHLISSGESFVISDLPTIVLSLGRCDILEGEELRLVANKGSAYLCVDAAGATVTATIGRTFIASGSTESVSV